MINVAFENNKLTVEADVEGTIVQFEIDGNVERISPLIAFIRLKHELGIDKVFKLKQQGKLIPKDVIKELETQMKSVGAI